MTKEKSKAEFVQIRLTAKDKAKLQANANKEGKSMSNYIRAKTL